MPNDWRAAADIKWNPTGYLPAAMGINGGTGPGGGPIWCIFDADGGAAREIDRRPTLCGSGGRLLLLRQHHCRVGGHIKNKYQKNPMPAQALQETVARYNSFVDAGKDADFDKAAPKYKIETPPFYAAWAVPIMHDSRTGLRVNTNFQVQDLNGQGDTGPLLRGRVRRWIQRARRRPVRRPGASRRQDTPPRRRCKALSFDEGCARQGCP